MPFQLLSEITLESESQLEKVQLLLGVPLGLRLFDLRRELALTILLRDCGLLYSLHFGHNLLQLSHLVSEFGELLRRDETVLAADLQASLRGISLGHVEHVHLGREFFQLRLLRSHLLDSAQE